VFSPFVHFGEGQINGTETGLGSSLCHAVAGLAQKQEIFLKKLSFWLIKWVPDRQKREQV